MDLLNKLLLFLIIVALPLGEIARISVSEIAVTLMDISVVALVGLWFFKKRRIPKAGLKKPLGIFIGLLFFSLLVNSTRLEFRELFISFLYMVRWIFYVFLYFIVFDLNRFKPQIEKWMITGGFVIVLIGFIQYFLYPDLRNLFYAGWDEHLYRMFSTFLDPNFAGTFFVLFFMFLMDKLLIKDKNLVLKIILVLTFIAIILTFSRSAYIAFIVAVIFLSTLNKRKIFGLLVVTVFVLSVSIASVMVLKSEGTNLLRKASSEARIESMNKAIKIIKDYPIFGVGFNSYRYAQQDYGFINESKMLVHSAAGTDNSFLFILATSGVVGSLAFIYLYYKVFMINSNLLKVSLISLFVNSLFVNSLFFPPIMIWMWILIALRENN